MERLHDELRFKHGSAEERGAVAHLGGEPHPDTHPPARCQRESATDQPVGNVRVAVHLGLARHPRPANVP